MWIVELSFAESEAHPAARPAHRETLKDLHAQGVVRMAGPLADDSGAIIIVDLEDRAAIDEFLEADPYYGTDGVSVADVREWAPFLT